MALLVFSALLLIGCTQTPHTVPSDAVFDYPHKVIQIDGRALLAGDLRYNINLRDGDVVWASDTPAFRNTPPFKLQPDRVRPSEIGTRVNAWEYRAKPNDYLLVTIYELHTPGIDDQQQSRVDEHGEIHLSVVGLIKAASKSASELEREIAGKLEADGRLRNATVSVQFLKTQAKVYIRNTSAGDPHTLSINGPGLRLVEAIHQSGGMPED